MATATPRFTKTEEKRTTEGEKKTGVTLQLSFEEAATIKGILCRVGYDRHSDAASDTAWQYVLSLRNALAYVRGVSDVYFESGKDYEDKGRGGDGGFFLTPQSAVTVRAAAAKART